MEGRRVLRGRRLAVGMFVLTVCASCAFGAGEGWSKWRGPEATGISKETGWNPSSLSKGPKFVWKKSIEPGYAAISVKGSYAFTMGNDGEKDIVYCLRTKDGSEVWRHSYPCSRGKYPGPRSTPVLDGKMLYTLSKDGHLFCFDALKGTVKWQKNIMSDYGARRQTWGFSASPVIVGKMLLINSGSSGLALDKATGSKLWASPPGVANYATPVIYTKGSKEYAAIFSQKKLNGVDISDGKVLWSFVWETRHSVNAADPIVFDDKVFVSSGYGRGCTLYSIKGNRATQLWENKALRAHFGTPILHEGHLYGVDGNAGRGSLKCLKTSDGSQVWSHDTGFASLIMVDEKLIVLNERGKLFIAEATTAGYKELGTGQVLPRKTCWTAPTFSDGMLYCRNDKGDAVCVDLR